MDVEAQPDQTNAEDRTQGSTVSVVGVFDSSVDAERALEQLRGMGVSPDEVSVMMRDSSHTEQAASEPAGSAVAGGAATGAAFGGLLGGLAGWMISIGAIAIPGVGWVVGAGALAALITGMAIGAATGGLIGALLGLGVPEEDAREYEDHVREGRILVTIHPAANLDPERMAATLQENGAYDVRVYDTPGVSSEQAPDEYAGIAAGAVVASEMATSSDEQVPEEYAGIATGTEVAPEMAAPAEDEVTGTIDALDVAADDAFARPEPATEPVAGVAAVGEGEASAAAEVMFSGAAGGYGSGEPQASAESDLSLPDDNSAAAEEEAVTLEPAAAEPISAEPTGAGAPEDAAQGSPSAGDSDEQAGNREGA